MVRTMAVALWLLNVADLLVTRWLISTGQAIEGNPLMAPIIMDWRGATIKVVGVGLAMVFAVKVARRVPGADRWVQAALSFLVIFYTILLLFNLHGLV